MKVVHFFWFTKSKVYVCLSFYPVPPSYFFSFASFPSLSHPIMLSRLASATWSCQGKQPLWLRGETHPPGLIVCLEQQVGLQKISG